MQVSTSQSRSLHKSNYLPFIIEFTRRVSRTVLTFGTRNYIKDDSQTNDVGLVEV
jgi:hypothetical protein